MKKSNVWFIDFRATSKENIPAKLERLIETAGLQEVVQDRDLTAVKIHFGERGNTAFIRPVYVRRIIETIKKTGASPFLTDTNTLYAGTRSDAPSHLKTAIQNGFAYSVVEAPIVIADGLRGRSDIAVEINGDRFSEVYIGTEIVQADALVSVAHFKGHELAGFGGSIKNLAMGCASRRGKMAQHSTVSPKVKRKTCVGCAECVPHCPREAISIDEEDKAVIDSEKCIGCGECILICPQEAIQIRWNQTIPIFLENIAEYAYGAVQGKTGKCLFVNFITNVSPACDCLDHNDTPIVRDIGILASTDPVAIDQASVDLVNNETALPGTSLTTNMMSGEDKFKGLHPNVDWEIQLAHAEKLGMGNRSYELQYLEVNKWKNEGRHTPPAE